MHSSGYQEFGSIFNKLVLLNDGHDPMYRDIKSFDNAIDRNGICIRCFLVFPFIPPSSIDNTTSNRMIFPPTSDPMATSHKLKIHDTTCNTCLFVWIASVIPFFFYKSQYAFYSFLFQMKLDEIQRDCLHLWFL